MRVIIQEEALRRSEGHYYHRFIQELPTIDAVPAVHGRWIDNTKLIKGVPDYRFNCSECNYAVWRMAKSDRTRYCPNCGAKMDAEESINE